MGQILISFPVFLVLSVVQSVAVSRIKFLSGSGDIVMLALISWIVIDEEGNYLGWALIAAFFISILSAMPMASVFLVYGLAALIAKIVSRILWQSPILALFAASGIATLVKFLIELFTLQFMDIPAQFLLSLSSILLPTLLLNLFFTFPLYIFMGDISRWVSPKDEKYV